MSTRSSIAFQDDEHGYLHIYFDYADEKIHVEWGGADAVTLTDAEIEAMQRFCGRYW